VKYIGDFNDVAGGNELAGVLYNQGADIIYVAAGKAGLGAIQELRQRSGVYAIGVDSDQDALAPGRILTSVMKRIDRSVLLLSGMAARHQPRPQRLELGLAEDAVGLTDFHYTRDIVTAATRQRLDVIRAALIAKKIVAPSTRAELANFVRVPL